MILSNTSEVRVIVSKSDFFDDNHRKRLLERISQIVFEVFRDKGRFAEILGGVVDFSDALGRFGKKVKPLVDRMTEIRKITQSHTRSYDGLPPPDEVKRLPAPEEGESSG